MAVSTSARYAGGAGSSGQWLNPGWNPATGSWSNGSPGSSAQTGFAGSSVGSGMDDLLRQINQINQSNNVWSAQQAQRQMDFQADQAKLLREFNSGEAEKDRLWQQYMSDTAHQREVKDLAAAGLNPVLSANSGAAVTSGATAAGYSPPQGSKGDTDMSGSAALASIFGSLLQAQTTLTSQALSAQNNLAVAEKYTAATRYSADTAASSARDVAQTHASSSIAVAQISAGATLSAANIHAMATQAAASINAQAHLQGVQAQVDSNQIVAAMNNASQRYGYDLSSMTQKELAQWNYGFNRSLQDAKFDGYLELQKSGQDFQLVLSEKEFGHNLTLTAEKGILDGLSTISSSLISKYIDSLPYSVTSKWVTGGSLRGGTFKGTRGETFTRGR